ncbi:hypothetical protein P9H32_13870 [Pontiella sp. NLcol2]|uniref:Uncharacterized protein n=1 Tax=Pontiella agarivorans TaxID=3038953 RepID=A0ABU5N0E6_9BACT|nr:hypothetical protein [Pontiella agarivorans]
MIGNRDGENVRPAYGAPGGRARLFFNGGTKKERPVGTLFAEKLGVA